eukprot:UN29221
MCDPEQKHVRGQDGGFVNEIIVENTSQASFVNNKTHSDARFSQIIPESDQFVRQPPHAPTHLGEIILNTLPDPTKDRNPLLLPIPSHVSLHHVYVAERKETDVMILGIPQRFQDKTYTTVYYKSLSQLGSEPNMKNKLNEPLPQ